MKPEEKIKQVKENFKASCDLELPSRYFQKVAKQILEECFETYIRRNLSVREAAQILQYLNKEDADAGQSGTSTKTHRKTSGKKAPAKRRGRSKTI